MTDSEQITTNIGTLSDKMGVLENTTGQTMSAMEEVTTGTNETAESIQVQMQKTTEIQNTIGHVGKAAGMIVSDIDAARADEAEYRRLSTYKDDLLAVFLYTCYNKYKYWYEEQLMEDGRKKILVIDDSSVILSSVSHILSSKYKVYCATSGPKAMDIIEVSPPDLIFLDYEMPGFNGKDTYEFIKQHPGMENVPIVFLTAISDVGRVKELIDLKPAGYLLKPPTPFKILEAAQNCLG